VKTVVGD